MTNERETVRIAAEAIFLLIYAWNSAPIPGTDLPCCLVALGRIFTFPIDFSSSKHLELTSSPSKVESFARDQATLLSYSRAIAKVLLEEHRAYHRELINSRRPDPRIFEIGDVVFAKRATKSVASKGRVGKLMFPMTGPWRVVEKLDGASYRIEHCLCKGHFEKKHASMLSPYPLELVPFEPIDGPDSRFGQINKPISKSPFIDSGITMPLSHFNHLNCPPTSHQPPSPMTSTGPPSQNSMTNYFHFLGNQAKSHPFVTSMMTLTKSLLCIMDPLHLRPLLPNEPRHQLPSLPLPSSEAPTGSSSSPSLSPRRNITNGVLFASLWRIPCLCILRAYKTVDSSWNLISLMLVTFVTTASTNVFGYNTILWPIAYLPLSLRIHIS
jgi:hypothetical protein